MILPLFVLGSFLTKTTLSTMKPAFLAYAFMSLASWSEGW
jgi:hypothetical protein